MRHTADSRHWTLDLFDADIVLSMKNIGLHLRHLNNLLLEISQLRDGQCHAQRIQYCEDIDNFLADRTCDGR
jgi:hypothetical protein